MPAVVNVELCEGCTDCVESCPVEAIAMASDKAKVNEEECTDCGACVDSCPTEAIELQ